jgi:hypothetical protein
MDEKTPPQVGQLCDDLKARLGWTQRKVAVMLGMSKDTLSNNRDRTLSELTPMTGRKLIDLYFLVTKHLIGYHSDAIVSILNIHVFKSPTGETDSLLSSIQQNKFELDTLVQILKSAKQRYELQCQQECPILKDVETHLYA